MKNIYVLLFLFTSLSWAQVGINNEDPKAMLDITVSDAATPNNTDGVLIPRMDEYPTGMTTDQDGMLVFITGAGTPTKGFYYYSDGTGWLPVAGNGGGTLDNAYDFGGAGAGKNIDASDGALRINGDDGFLVTGTFGSGDFIDAEITGAGTRMFFNPRKAAFRAGNVSADEWDAANTGDYSAAFGQNTFAIGEAATAFGNLTDASGVAATTFGNLTAASGNQSTAFGFSTSATGAHATAFGDTSEATAADATAFGQFTVASGDQATSFGKETEASGTAAAAFGDDTIASGARSFSQGSDSEASGFGAVAFGLSTVSSNTYSFASGQATVASGINASAFGRNSRATSYAEMAIGSFSRTYTANNPLAFDAGDRAFVIGNGTGLGLLSHNAFEVWKDGRVEINEAYSFPLTDGSNGQVMTTDGAGNVSFQTVTDDTGNDWTTSGNASTNPTTNFIGTTDAQDLSIRTQNTEKVRITTQGQIETYNTGGSVFIGELAGENDDLSNNQNIAIGQEALQTNTSSNKNVAIGFKALKLSTGDSNTALGWNALSVSTSAIQNTALGYATLRANTAGSSNTAIGYQSLSGNTTGANNTATGRTSLDSNTIGNNNTGTGYHAIFSNTSGNDNTAIGFDALFGNVTGDGNAAIGYKAGNIAKGDHNTFLGFRAGDSDDTSTQNVYVGAFAGGGNYSGTTMTGQENKSGNVFMGYRAGYNENGSNKLYVENSDNSAPLIYGEFDNNILRTNGEFQVGNPTGAGYALPTSDGTNGQVMTTDGTGSVSWQNGSTTMTPAITRVTLGASQTFVGTGVTKMNFDTTEFDIGGNFDTTTDTFVVPTDGIYRVNVQYLVSSSSSTGTFGINILVDGANERRHGYNHSGAGPLTRHTSSIIELTAGQAIHINVIHADAISLTTIDQFTYFEIERIH